MKKYKSLTKEYLSKYAVSLRKRRNLTQEEMAESLRITSRAYGDLERGKYCFSSVALLFLFLMLKDEELKEFLEEFRKKVNILDHQEAA